MQVITISGFKGGTGKTTLAALLSVAATIDGLRVGALDLDRNTRNLTDFLTLRRAAGLPCPDHVMPLDFDAGNVKRPSVGRLAPLVRLARLDGYDLLIIDTSSGNHTDLYEAHFLADVILTPLNESPADLHGLFTPPKAPSAPLVNYRDLIDTVRFDRRRAGLPAQPWHICRNRTSALPTRIGNLVVERLEAMAGKLGFESLFELRDRVAHRAIAHQGRTVFDAQVDGRLSLSELAGRSEVRTLLSALVASGAEARTRPSVGGRTARGVPAWLATPTPSQLGPGGRAAA